MDSTAPFASPGRTWPRALLMAFPMALWGLLMATPSMMGGGGASALASLGSQAFMLVLFFLMVKTGRTHVYRRVFFVSLAFLFPVGFIANLIAERGSMGLPMEAIVSGNTPFCHLAIPMVIIPAALTKTLVFPGSILPSPQNPHAVAPMIALWAAATVILGRGFCSLGCFFGGLEEGFSACLKKPRIRRIPPRWRWLAWAVLVFAVVGSLLTFYPVYCSWLCPFKAVTEFSPPTTLERIIQMVIFGSIFVGLVIVLPLLTKKRAQCALFCPLGALQSATNKLNVFDIRIDREKCTDCLACERACPTLSLDKASIQQGRTLMSCTKCGACVDTCTKGAAVWHVKGTTVGKGSGAARTLYLYAGWAFASMFGGSIIAGSLLTILRMFH